MVEVEAEVSVVSRRWLGCFFPWEEVVEGAFLYPCWYAGCALFFGKGRRYEGV